MAFGFGGGGGGTQGEPGLSAYEVAVVNGFVGTEAEWLASLVGAPGQDGSDGTNGAQGDPGPAGTTNYAELQNVPTTFTPSAHAHQPADVAGTAVVTNDARLSDARAPTAHSHAASEVTGTAVVTNDARLSDARTPTAHVHVIDDSTGLQTALNGKEAANANIQAHVAAAHAPSNAQVNADITKAEIEAKLTGEIASHSHAGSGTPLPLYIPIAVPVLAALVWTNMPAALSFWLSTATVAKGTTRVDLTNYTQVRLLVNKQGTAGAAAAKLILRYKAAPWTQVVANYSDIGASEVSVAINVQNSFLDSGWINLAAGAKADVFIDLLGSGGDGTVDPAFGYIAAAFK